MYVGDGDYYQVRFLSGLLRDNKNLIDLQPEVILLNTDGNMITQKY